MKNRSENEDDTNLNSIKISEESPKVGSFSYNNEVNHDSYKKFDENWDECNHEEKLNNKEFITRIQEYICSSILSIIDLKITQVEESLKPEISKNNEKIDRNITIMNENKEILNDNLNSLSSLSSSIETIQDLISKQPQTEAIKNQFLNIDSTLAVSSLA